VFSKPADKNFFQAGEEDGKKLVLRCDGRKSIVVPISTSNRREEV